MSDDLIPSPEPSPEPPAQAPAPAPDAERRRLLRRRIATVAMVVFVVFGIFFFGGRMPKDVALRFEVPAMVRGVDGARFVEFPRMRMASLTGDLTTEAGAHIGRVSVNLPHGLDGPLAPAVGIQLKPGRYRAHLVARALNGSEVPLEGGFEVDAAGEVRVELRPSR